MRISPLVFYIHRMPVRERFDLTKKVSSITHGHIRSVIACFCYLEFMGQLLAGETMLDAYKKLQAIAPDFFNSRSTVDITVSDEGVTAVEQSIDKSEVSRFDRLLMRDIRELPEDQIESGGYVVDTLEAAMWCLLTTDNYKDAVLKAVNLGDDTDTTGCVTGAAAGLYYGYGGIPREWVRGIRRRDDIADLAERLRKKMYIA